MNRPPRAAIGLALGLSACVNCTQMGCSNGVALVLEGALVADIHTLTVAFDGEQQTCDIDVGFTEDLACDREDLFGVSVNPDTAIYADVFGAFPDTVHVVLVDPQGLALVDEVVQPIYGESSPNGERCGPTCTATATGTGTGTGSTVSTTTTTTTTPNQVCLGGVNALNAANIPGNGMAIFCHMGPNGLVAMNVPIGDCLTHIGHGNDLFPTTICDS